MPEVHLLSSHTLMDFFFFPLNFISNLNTQHHTTLPSLFGTTSIATKTITYYVNAAPSYILTTYNMINNKYPTILPDRANFFDGSRSTLISFPSIVQGICIYRVKMERMVYFLVSLNWLETFVMLFRQTIFFSSSSRLSFGKGFNITFTCIVLSFVRQVHTIFETGNWAFT